jgi:hypothetical protein
VDLHVSPSLIGLRLEPGEGALRSIELRNDGDETLEIAARLADWTMAEDGSVRFAEAGSTERSCSTMLSLIPERTLVPAGGKASVLLVARGPHENEALRRSRWAVVLLELPEVLDLEGGEPVRVAIRLSTTVYVTGRATPPPRVALEIGETNLPPDPASAAIPEAVVRNDGDMMTRFSIRWTLSSHEGDRIAEVRRDDQVVLPDSKRLFRLEPERPLPPGEYDVVVVLTTARGLRFEDGARLLVR